LQPRQFLEFMPAIRAFLQVRQQPFESTCVDLVIKQPLEGVGPAGSV
jgi:hypothetical protein